ncbi:hypothetical protein ASG89_22265 [Paenibacillus sp. Soil766]|nr:hypothetical protein ASG89_22265 [Paenibacillus sp. Soil766]
MLLGAIEGIGTFGPIDVNPQSPAYGSVTRTPKPHWSGYRIVEHLKRSIGGSNMGGCIRIEQLPVHDDRNWDLCGCNP